MSEWDLSSGFALDGAVGRITNAEFGFNANIGAGITCLNLTIETEDGDEEQSFSVGDGVEATRDGSELANRDRKIGARSNYGRLLASVVKVLKENDLDPADEIGSPYEAESWVGTVWTWGTEEIESTNPKTGERGMRSKFIVTEYHGKGDDRGDAKSAKGGAKKSTKSSGARDAKSDAKDDTVSAPKGVEQGLWDYVVAAAKSYEGDHQEFLSEMLEDEDVAGNRPLMKALMSPSGVWAAAGR